jgi:general secretion pathway protein N
VLHQPDLSLVVKPRLGRVETTLNGPADWIAQWPAAVLSGLGTPWNTLDLGGAVRLSARDLALDWVQGRLRVRGNANVQLLNVSSRITTLERLGSYTIGIMGNPQKAGAAELTLSTSEGALVLSGQGTVGPQGVYFRGEATAAEGQQAALSNLLNIIGRRQGARSVISIG